MIRNKYRKVFYLKLISVALFFIPVFFFAFGQNETTVEKKNATLDLKYKNEDGKRSIDIRLFRKEKKEFIPIIGKTVELYVDSVSPSFMIGTITTDDEGNGTLNIDKRFKEVTAGKSSSAFNFIGMLRENPEVETEQAELPIHEAMLTISLFEEDSLHKVKATLMEVNDDKTQKPVADAEIHFYVKREFSLLPVTESAVNTDENGEAIADFPNTIKGDSS